MRTLDDTEAGIFDYTDYLDILDSDVLDAAWYNEKNRGLVLEFKNGTLAGYNDVNRFCWHDFMHAASKGSYYNRNIKHIFPGFSVPPGTMMSRIYDEDELPEQKDLTASEATRSWKVSAHISAPVEFEVTGDTLEDALLSFATKVREKVGESVSIDFRSVKNT